MRPLFKSHMAHSSDGGFSYADGGFCQFILQVSGSHLLERLSQLPAALHSRNMEIRLKRRLLFRVDSNSTLQLTRMRYSAEIRENCFSDSLRCPSACSRRTINSARGLLASRLFMEIKWGRKRRLLTYASHRVQRKSSQTATAFSAVVIFNIEEEYEQDFIHRQTVLSFY